MDIDGWIWGLVIVGGPVLLGIAMFVYGGRRRKLTQRERETAHENWGKERIH